MQTKKQQLTENAKTYSNDEHILECWYSEHLSKFCLMFNAKLQTFKTYNGLVNNRNKFIEKYNLIEQN